MTTLRLIETAQGNLVKPIGIYPGPTRLVVDSAGSDDLGTVFAVYAAHGTPHYTIDVRKRAVYSHLDPVGAAPVVKDSTLAPHRRGLVIWVCIAKHPSEELTSSETKWVGEVVGTIATELDIPIENVTDFPGSVNSRDKGVQMTWGAWLGFSGIASAAAVPEIPRYGPGKLDRDAFIQGLNKQKVISELIEFPSFRGRPVSLGSKGKRVEHLQAIFGLEVTGTYDEELAEIITEWKEERGIEGEDLVDASVWKELEKFFTANSD